MEDTLPHKVLIVDKERLAGLITKMLTGRYGTVLAHDGVTAVQTLAEQEPNVIVAGLDIPGSGLRLAEIVGISPKYIDVPVILTSAKPSPDTIIQAAKAGASSYLAKPFKPSDLRTRIESALAQLAPAPQNGTPADSDDEAIQEDPSDEEGEDFLTRVKSIEGLPSFPATHAEILKLAKSDDSSSDDIAQQLQLDPGLLATVFKLVNSSYYGFKKPTNSIALAVTLLGLEEVANLVMAAQVFEKLGNYEDGGGLDLKEFWRHSVGTAFIARACAQKLQTEVETSFLAGMLHDLGKIILDRYFGDYYQAVFQTIESAGLSLYESEQKILGLSHAEVGGQLAQEWKFSDHYLNTILHHHSPGDCRRYARLVCIIHIADIICRQLEFGSGGDDQVPDYDSEALDRFSLQSRGMDVLVDAGKAELDNADSFLSALGN